MNLCNINHGFNYELEKLCRIFLPYEKISVINEIVQSEIYAVCKIEDCNCSAYLNFFGKEFEYPRVESLMWETTWGFVCQEHLGGKHIRR